MHLFVSYGNSLSVYEGTLVLGSAEGEEKESGTYEGNVVYESGALLFEIRLWSRWFAICCP